MIERKEKKKQEKKKNKKKKSDFPIVFPFDLNFLYIYNNFQTTRKMT